MLAAPWSSVRASRVEPGKETAGEAASRRASHDRDRRVAAAPDARRLWSADRPPPLRAAPLAADKIDSTVPGPDHPPGYYGPSGAARAFNIITAKTVLKPLGTIEGAAAVSGYVLQKPMALEPWLYLAVLGLFSPTILVVLC